MVVLSIYFNIWINKYFSFWTPLGLQITYFCVYFFYGSAFFEYGICSNLQTIQTKNHLHM